MEQDKILQKERTLFDKKKLDNKLAEKEDETRHDIAKREKSFEKGTG